MDQRSKNEDWLLCTAAQVARKKVGNNCSGLSDWQCLVLCVWSACDVLFQKRDAAFVAAEFPRYKAEGVECAQRLGLERTEGLFKLEEAEFGPAFKANIDVVCDELRSVCEARRR
ncbi:MAG TPA: hypothetical protein VF988_13855 [Verrucomicrobiae bacterium]